MNWQPIIDQAITTLGQMLPWMLVMGCVFIGTFILLRNLPKLVAIQSIFNNLHPAFIDGLLLMVSAFLTAWLTYISTEEAYKYVNPVVLFWIKVGFGSSSSAIQALVAFRNKQFAEYLKGKQEP